MLTFCSNQQKGLFGVLAHMLAAVASKLERVWKLGRIIIKDDQPAAMFAVNSRIFLIELRL
jgi:hypothetical protein